MHWSIFLSLGFLLQRTIAQNTSRDPLTYVDQLIGSNNGGNVFVGASLPYGMAKAVADVDGENTGGFATDGSNVTGFSHMHDSGTGGNPSQGQFPLFPQVCPGDINSCNFSINDRAVAYVNGSVEAKPGYFAVGLANGIHAEMTVTRRAALYNFRFPATNSTGGTSTILLDLTDLWQSRQNATTAVDPTTGTIRANGTFLPSFGSGYYEAFVCASFHGARVTDTGTWINSRGGSEPKDIFITRGINLFYLQGGSWVQFEQPANNTITARVGVSFVSTEQACQNALEEIPDPLSSFGTIRATAEAAWREKLARVSVTPGAGVNESLVTAFYSGIYRTMLSPQNYTGENPKWSGKNGNYWDSFYCLWDLFRTQMPLLSVLDPDAVQEMLNALLDVYVHEGWLPDCRMTLCKGFTQGGSNAENVFGDVYAKNSTGWAGGIDWELVWRAIVNDAEHEPIDWSNEGRGGVVSWAKLGYVPFLDYDYLGFGTNSRSVSRTVEYAYNDFAIAGIGKGLGKGNSSMYLARSNAWKALYRADQTSYINGTDTGFTGFLQPKCLNGSWGYQDPITCSPLTDFCSLTTNPQETFEDSIWEYQFFVPQDQASLIETLGGKDTFVERLDYLHESGLQDISNEPSFLNCFLYHYAQRPALSTARIHQYIPSFFNATHGGLPGNDDSGTMGAFQAFAMSGLYPNAGQNVYLILSPFFESVSYTHPVTGKTATVRNINFDASYTNVYIQNATLDGQTYSKNWIGHEFFLDGGVLELTLGATESAWGTGEDDIPPSTGLGMQ